MRDLLPALRRFESEGRPVGRAVVVQVWGSAPRQAGAAMLVTADAHLEGSVSGGCVETAVVAALQEALERGRPRLVEYGVSNAAAWDVGLACGGAISIWLEPGIRPELPALAEAGGACLATIVGGTPAPGAALLVRDDGSPAQPLPPVGRHADPRTALAQLDAVAPLVDAAARDALRSDASRVLELPAPNRDDATGHAGGESGPLVVLLEVLARRPTLVIVGAVAAAAALVPMARQLGFRTVVMDGREVFLDRTRFPDADELVLAWPAEGFARVGLDRGSFVCILSHDPKFDEPALEAALRSEARYVGAIGSRKTQQARRALLRERGFDAATIARLHGPIGLDLGGRDPAETALAILAELVAVRYGARDPLRGNR